MRFALSAEDIEAGPLGWDLGRPYYNRRGHDGYCHRCDPAGPACGVYEERPSVCRNYSCAGDDRIWTDFDGMELNQEWIDANLGGDELSPGRDLHGRVRALATFVCVLRSHAACFRPHPPTVEVVLPESPQHSPGPLHARRRGPAPRADLALRRDDPSAPYAAERRRLIVLVGVKAGRAWVARTGAVR